MLIVAAKAAYWKRYKAKRIKRVPMSLAQAFYRDKDEPNDQYKREWTIFSNKEQDAMNEEVDEVKDEDKGEDKDNDDLFFPTLPRNGHSAAAKQRWKDPVYREKQRLAHQPYLDRVQRSRKETKYLQNLEYLKKARATFKMDDATLLRRYQNQSEAARRTQLRRKEKRKQRSPEILGIVQNSPHPQHEANLEESYNVPASDRRRSVYSILSDDNVSMDELIALRNELFPRRVRKPSFARWKAYWDTRHALKLQLNELANQLLSGYAVNISAFFSTEKASTR
jgi:hypothetical protein